MDQNKHLCSFLLATESSVYITRFRNRQNLNYFPSLNSNFRNDHLYRSSYLQETFMTTSSQKPSICQTTHEKARCHLYFFVWQNVMGKHVCLVENLTAVKSYGASVNQITILKFNLAFAFYIWHSFQLAQMKESHIFTLLNQITN